MLNKHPNSSEVTEAQDEARPVRPDSPGTRTAHPCPLHLASPHLLVYSIFPAACEAAIVVSEIRKPRLKEVGGFPRIMPPAGAEPALWFQTWHPHSSGGGPGEGTGRLAWALGCYAPTRCNVTHRQTPSPLFGGQRDVALENT